MAKSGDVIGNPVTGELVTFERTAGETGGELLSFRIQFTPRGFLAQNHLHPRQTELHEVIAGSVGIHVDGHERVLGPGDSLLVPAGKPHRLIDRGPCEMRQEVRPALRQEVLMETIVGLACDGKLSKRGLPKPLQLAVFAREFEDEGYALRPPIAVQRALFAPLAAIGRRRGYRGSYAKYSGDGARTCKVASSPRSGDRGYVFIDEWDIDAPIEAVFEAISDARTYPAWWRPVYLDVEADGPPRVGAVARQHFRGRLPYHLRTTATVVSIDAPHRIEGTVAGDLSGRGIWTLTPRASGTHVQFDWRVNADKPILRVLTPVLKPLFRWNHDWAIARAKEGLEPWARRRARERVSQLVG
jgi:quercetin dioxygenase-like cupin family protein